MKYRIPLIAGAAGAGALALVLVGPGSFASFTSSVTANQNISSGTFRLQGVAGTPTVAGPLIGDANSIGQPNLSSSTGDEPTGPGFNGNTLTFNLGNINPGDTYTEPVTIYDVGSLQGQVNTVTYTPGAYNAAARNLESTMTVTVQVDENGTWTDVHTSAQERACGGCGSNGTPVSAASPQTFVLDNSFGPQYLQPNPKLYSSSQASAAGFSTNELSASFQIVFSFTDTSGSQNNVENVSAAPSLSFNGTNTP